MKRLAIGLFVLLSIYSCKKDTVNPEPPAEEPIGKGTLTINLKGMVDAQNLVLGNSYKNAVGDTFVVNLFKYYISNIVLTAADGTKFYEPESYHLIAHTNTATPSISLANIPPGNYKSIAYLIGVDSARNVSGAQDYDLSPSKGMYWPWLGYIMLKFEGTSPQATSSAGTLAFHIGGFSGANNVIKSRSITFPQDIVIASTKTPKLNLITNVNELFKNPSNFSFSTTYDITTPGIFANGFANNYADMISFESITP